MARLIERQNPEENSDSHDNLDSFLAHQPHPVRNTFLGLLTVIGMSTGIYFGGVRPLTTENPKNPCDTHSLTHLKTDSLGTLSVALPAQSAMAFVGKDISIKESTGLEYNNPNDIHYTTVIVVRNLNKQSAQIPLQSSLPGTNVTEICQRDLNSTIDYLQSDKEMSQLARRVTDAENMQVAQVNQDSHRLITADITADGKILTTSITEVG